MLFLSGSISTAIRNVYDGLFGVQPALDGLVISPAVPPEWSKSEVEIPYLGRKLHIAFMRDQSATKITVITGGREIGCAHESCITGREGVLIPDDVVSGLSGDSLEVHIPQE
jgi:cellobiose phosphorylase